MPLTRFEANVLKCLRQVPAGKITTYLELAKAVGSPRAVRAVGNALNKNPWAPRVPCHRVVKSNGCIGGFARGTRAKTNLLKKEGVRVKDDKIADFNLRIYKF